MQIRMIGNIFIENQRRMAGTYMIAYEITTPSGKVGAALFHYEYDKRDTMAENLSTTPEIADEVRKFVGDESPAAFTLFCFPKPEETNQNGDAVTDTIKIATEPIYEYNG